MIKIRKNTFETNSSSMHSLVVVKNPKPYNNRELGFDVYCTDQDFKLFDWCDEGVYERSPYRVLRTPVQKLRYYVAYTIGTCHKEDEIDKIKKFVSEHTNIPIDKISLHHTETHYLKNGGVKETVDYGYVSGNDTGEDVFSFIERNHITMEELVLNPKYVIVIDGDEYQLFKALFESNLLNEATIEDISSGLPFWTDSECEVYLDWLNPNGNLEWSDEHFAEDVNGFTEVVTFMIDYENKPYYNADRIRNIIRLMRERNPKVKIRLCKDYYSKKKVSITDLDTSMFDEVNVNNTQEEINND